ncbi:Glucan endo-1,3-beta-D-glucosidase [Bertholletia excelsa]
MAEDASMHLFFSLLFTLSICTSGTLVGLSYDAREHHGTSSSVGTLSKFFKHTQVSPSQIRVFVQDLQALDTLSNSHASVDLFINETLVKDLRNQKPSAISWLKTHLTTFLPNENFKNVVVSGSTTHHLPRMLSSLRSIHSILSSFHLQDRLNVSVSFPLSFLENLNGEQRRDLHVVLNFIKEIKAFVIIEVNYDGKLIPVDPSVKSLLERAKSSASVLPCNKVATVLKIKSSSVPSAFEFSEFTDKILRSLKSRTTVGRGLTELLVEVSPHEEEQIFHSSHRQLLGHFGYNTTVHDTLYPPPTTFPPYTNPSPTIGIVPPTNPVTITPNPPTNPAVTSPLPTNNPVPQPYTNPMNSPVPITNPVTTPGTVPGTQPVTNPVTTYPMPSAGVPVTTPVTNPVAPPATTGGIPATTGGTPAVPGQSWCVARTGASEASLQAALDYACGIGGVDCSAIQEGASCYNPNTLEYHASYAFNSYFQKNPIQTSCDFGGTAIVTNTNPSSGTCIFQTSSSPSPSFGNTGTPTPNTASSAGATPTVPGSGSPPAVVNTGDPTIGSGSSSSSVFAGSPPTLNSTSKATSLQPFVSCITLGMSVVVGRFVLDK